MKVEEGVRDIEDESERDGRETRIVEKKREKKTEFAYTGERRAMLH